MPHTTIQAVAYCLIHVPSLVRYGTTVREETHRESVAPWLEALSHRLRSYESAVDYAPNQTYIGNLNPQDLALRPRPWYQGDGGGERFGPFGEIMPEEEFYGALALADSFQLISLEAGFCATVRERLTAHSCYGPVAATRLGAGVAPTELEEAVRKGALPLHCGDRLVGVVRQAHPSDPSLRAEVMLENLVNKASAALALAHLMRNAGASPETLDYLIECSEEAAGDMNQRGGGNFAKAVGELVGCTGATGSDVRAFCAAPTHAVIQGAALVGAGVYNRVAVFAGGSLAKLGMNCREHITKDAPVLEDVLGCFALLVGPDDGVNPVIRTDVVGRHTIGSGAAPQAVMQAVVIDPLARAGLKITDVDGYASELHNPEVTELAGAGDIPRSNLRMIAALGVRRGELDRGDLDTFTGKHGVMGFAPTQGHIPSGIPFIGHARQAMLAGHIRRALIIGKGSLFLGRMTNLFDGVSFLLERNSGQPAVEVQVAASARTRVALVTLGSELGAGEVAAAAQDAIAAHPELDVTLVGDAAGSSLPCVPATSPEAAQRAMAEMLATGKAEAAVTMHYPFPLGVASVGRVVTPGRGREMLIATCTGTTATHRVEALVRGAIYGQAVAEALGHSSPTLGILNLDGAAAAERILRQLAAAGYPVRFAASGRADGGALLRGNDVLAGSADILVTDSLTGNVLMKMISALTTGGSYESTGWGYGPGAGPGFPHVIGIVSRASGRPVIANAVVYAMQAARGGLPRKVQEHLRRAQAAGLEQLLGPRTPEPDQVAVTFAPQGPARKPVSREINGIDVLDLEAAVETLTRAGIYACPGMGCTGPVILVADEDSEKARQVLTMARVLS